MVRHSVKFLDLDRQVSKQIPAVLRLSLYKYARVLCIGQYYSLKL